MPKAARPSERPWSRLQSATPRAMTEGSTVVLPTGWSRWRTTRWMEERLLSEWGSVLTCRGPGAISADLSQGRRKIGVRLQRDANVAQRRFTGDRRRAHDAQDSGVHQARPQREGQGM